jgi:hypothetical protein
MGHRLSRKFIAVCLLIGIAYAGTAEAVIAIIHDFPIVGVVNGAQTARINAVLLPYIEHQASCPVTLSFLGGDGNVIGDPNLFELRAGVAVHQDFIGDPNTRPLDRVKVRPQVTISDPNQFPGCAGGVLTSVEIIDRLTRATHVILTNPVSHEVQR